MPNITLYSGVRGNQFIFFLLLCKGIIKCWGIPIPSECENLESNQFCLNSWNAHEDAIWDIEHHPLEVYRIIIN